MHCGYENYPTFTVALWFDNDRGRKALQRSMTRAHLRDGTEHMDVRMAEWLQEQVQASFDEDYVTAAMDESDTVASTFLSHVMTLVDWLGLARKYISEEKEETSG